MTPKLKWYVLEDIDGTYEYSPKKTHDMSDLDRVTDQYMKLTEVLKSNDSK